MTSFPYRLFGAAALDVGVYEEVEADRGATVQAAVVVVASSLATGFGAYGLTGRSGASLVAGALAWSALALVGWAAWALLVFEIGGRLMPTSETRVDVTELLRTIGFSTAPGFLCVLGVMPSVARPAFILAFAWMLVSMVVAVRQALDYDSTLRAVVVCLIGWTLSGLLVLATGFFVTPSLS
jgi:Yip1-like protein